VVLLQQFGQVLGVAQSLPGIGVAKGLDQLGFYPVFVLIGQISATLRRLCRVHRWMRALAPNILRTAMDSALHRRERPAARCRISSRG
jgi:hypothetical protein